MRIRARGVAQFTKAVGGVGGRTRRYTSRERASVGWMASSSSARAPRPGRRACASPTGPEQPSLSPATLYRTRCAHETPRSVVHRARVTATLPWLTHPRDSEERAMIFARARAGDGLRQILYTAPLFTYAANKNTPLPIFSPFVARFPLTVGRFPIEFDDSALSSARVVRNAMRHLGVRYI